MSKSGQCCSKCGEELVSKKEKAQPPPLQVIGLLLRVASIFGIIVGIFLSGGAVYLSLQIDEDCNANFSHKDLWQKRDVHLLSVTLKGPPDKLMKFDETGRLKEQSKKHMSEIYQRFFFQTYRRLKDYEDSMYTTSLMFKIFGIFGLILTIPSSLLVRYIGNTLSLPQEKMVCPQCPTR